MEAIGQLTGGIAHDFNNLLMAVLSSLELLRKRLPDDPRLSQLLDNAAQGAERGVGLTQRMLAFARRQELKPESIETVRLVRGLEELLQRTLGPSIAIEIRVRGPVRSAHADANQLELALLNLAVNARDAMPEGGVITIEVGEETPDRDEGLTDDLYVCIAVTDTGEGMDAETLARATSRSSRPRASAAARAWPVDGAGVCRTAVRASPAEEPEGRGHDGRDLAAGG